MEFFQRDCKERMVIKMTKNKTVLAWLDEMKELVNPDKIVWIDGSEEQLEELRKEACASGEIIRCV